MSVFAASLLLIPLALVQANEARITAPGPIAVPFPAGLPAVSAAFAAPQPDGGPAGAAGIRKASGAGSSTSTARRRVAPRVSKTRCAFVTCAPRCAIKGTRSEGGARVYRMPGSPAYEKARAEVMFCNRAEAQSAGYSEAGHS